MAALNHITSLQSGGMGHQSDQAGTRSEDRDWVDDGDSRP
jgi:hypothetical protein